MLSGSVLCRRLLRSPWSQCAEGGVHGGKWNFLTQRVISGAQITGFTVLTGAKNLSDVRAENMFYLKY